MKCFVLRHIKDTVNDLQGVVSSEQSGNHVVLPADDAVELAEGRQSGGPHPHDEVLVDEAVVQLVGVQLVDGPAPVYGLRCS